MAGFNSPTSLKTRGVDGVLAWPRRPSTPGGMLVVLTEDEELFGFMFLLFSNGLSPTVTCRFFY